jgi:hypothetical protein
MTKLLLQVSDITTDTTVTYTGQLESALIEVKGLLILKEYHPSSRGYIDCRLGSNPLRWVPIM